MAKWTQEERDSFFRATIHWGVAAFVIGFYGFYGLSVMEVRALGRGFVIVVITIELWKFIHAPFRAWVIRHYGELMRPHEKNGITGFGELAVGIYLAVEFFPKSVALLAIISVAADPVARIVGLHWGHVRLRNGKTLSGAFACLVASNVLTLALAFLLSGQDVSFTAAMLIRAPFYIAALELASRRHDNLIVPVGTAALLTIF
ncbi:MAG: Dolichol kinase [Candidatus Magasanikbacteria bacterium]|nr:Dolichol kinase [Candidatus Magasanikbacteria bacterium]